MLVHCIKRGCATHQALELAVGERRLLRGPPRAVLTHLRALRRPTPQRGGAKHTVSHYTITVDDRGGEVAAVGTLRGT